MPSNNTARLNELMAKSNRCSYCGCVLVRVKGPTPRNPPANMATVDHIYERVDPRRYLPGGGATVLACRACNATKGLRALAKKYGFDLVKNKQQKNPLTTMDIKITLDASPALQSVLEKIAAALTPGKTANPLTSVPKAPAEQEPPVNFHEPEAKAAPVAKKAPAAPAPTSTTTLEAVRAKAQEVAKAKGKEVLKALLDDFGAARVTELKEDQLTPFMEKLAAA